MLIQLNHNIHPIRERDSSSQAQPNGFILDTALLSVIHLPGVKSLGWMVLKIRKAHVYKFIQGLERWCRYSTTYWPDDSRFVMVAHTDGAKTTLNVGVIAQRVIVE